MRELQSLLRIREAEQGGAHHFDHLKNRIRCYAHVINVCSGHVIAAAAPTRPKSKKSKKSAKSRALDDSSDSDDELSNDDESSDDDEVPIYSNPDDWLAGIKLNPLKRARKIVRWLRSSDQRREAFRAFIINGNDSKLFKKADKCWVEPLQLLRDVKTRWDSVFLMLERLRELRPVSCLFYLKKTKDN
jgi:hypothetical protein